MTTDRKSSWSNAEKLCVAIGIAAVVLAMLLFAPGRVFPEEVANGSPRGIALASTGRSAWTALRPAPASVLFDVDWSSDSPDGLPAVSGGPEH